VPPWATAATNTLVGVLNTNLPLLVWFNQTGAPQGTNPPDFGFFGGAAVTSGVEVLTTNSVPPTPVLLPGQRYYLGVQNTNAVDLTYVFRVDFDITALTNGVGYTDITGTNSYPRFFSFDVTTNATAVQFALTNLDGDLNLVASRGHLPNAFGSYDYGSFQPGNNDEQILVFPSSTPVALAPGTWFLGVYPATTLPVNYTILATELTNAFPNIITLTNAVPYAAANAGPPGTADYYRYSVSTNAARVQIEIFGATGDFTLVAHKGLPLPDLATYDYRSTNPGTNDELIVITTNSSPVTLTSGDWFITVVKISAGPATYSIMATEATVTGQPITVTGAPDGFGDFCITWSSVPYAHYMVLATTNLAPPNWVDVSGPIVPLDYTYTWCTPMTGTMQFFQVVEGVSLGASTMTNLTISTVQVAPGGVTLTWYGDLNATNLVEWTDTLVPPTWTTVATNITSTTGIFTFTDDGTQTPPLGPMRFYRLLLP
jgi:hypothetical protein